VIEELSTVSSTTTDIISATSYELTTSTVVITYSEFTTPTPKAFFAKSTDGIEHLQLIQEY
jgi:hypothetical protein